MSEFLFPLIIDWVMQQTVKKKRTGIRWDFMDERLLPNKMPKEDPYDQIGNSAYLIRLYWSWQKQLTSVNRSGEG
jgi:hypothetical protein